MGEVEVAAAGVIEPVDEARRISSVMIGEIPKSPSQQEPEAHKEKLTAAEYLEKLTDGLSENDLSALRSYAEAAAFKREAQKDGRGDDSTYWGQVQGQSFKGLSSQAKTIAQQYAHAYNYYT
ncbi:MAG: hypothetical protein WAR37_04700 [Candidatus Microsaccharimonas sp.]